MTVKPLSEAGGALQPSSNDASPPLNATPTAASGESTKAQDAKLLTFIDEIFRALDQGITGYDAVKLAWVTCKMDGHVLSEGRQSSTAPVGNLMPAAAISVTATTTSTSRVSVSTKQPTSSKRRSDGSGSAPASKRTRAICAQRPYAPGKYTEASDDDDDSDEDEQEDETANVDFDAEDAAQRKRVNAERRRQKVIASNEAKLSHGATKQRDVE
jgi:hypothetical protein